jgi:hypothetical protein
MLLRPNVEKGRHIPIPHTEKQLLKNPEKDAGTCGERHGVGTGWNEGGCEEVGCQDKRDPAWGTG